MKILLCLALVAVLSLAGCQQRANDASQSTTHSTTVKVAPIKQTQTQAIAAFKHAFPQAHVVSIELAPVGSRYEYELEGQTDTQAVSFTLDANNGKVVHQSQEALEADDTEAALPTADILSRTRATQLAKAQVKQGNAQAWELSQDDGRIQWQVTINHQHHATEVILDAQSGEILEVDDENDD